MQTHPCVLTSCYTLPMTHLRQPIAWFAVVAALIFGAGVLAGVRVATPKETRAVSTQTILTTLHDQGFLVTQTFIFNTPVTIERSTGSAFKDLFLGQTIEARGTMEVNLGIDLADVTSEDVTVTDEAVTVTIPAATLFNTRLVGPIDVQNRQGILKRMFDSDDGYNEALAELSRAAEQAAQQDELLGRANDRAKDDVMRLVGYVAKEKRIEVLTP